MSLLCAEKANEFAKGDASISNNMGVTYLVMKEEVAAIAEFQSALEKDPGHIQANLIDGLVIFGFRKLWIGKTEF